jgi:hypothetical protein
MAIFKAEQWETLRLVLNRASGFNVNSMSGFQPRDARLKSTQILSRATRGSRFCPFVELTLRNEAEHETKDVMFNFI